MESSPGGFPSLSPLSGPATPTPTNHSSTTMDIDNLPSSPVLPYLAPSTPTRAPSTVPEPSSDPLGFTPFPIRESAGTHRLPKRKFPTTSLEPDQDPTPRPTRTSNISNNITDNSIDRNTTSKEAILKARDLIVYAYSKTPRDQQSKLLDLLEVFREYTESGNISKASNIISTQIANLEGTIRSIETKTRKLGNNIPSSQPTQSPTFASVARETNNSPLQEWTKVVKKPLATTIITPKPKLDRSIRRLILTQTGHDTVLSPLILRNSLNKAFLNKGIQGPVIASITKSLKANLVITTTSDFTAEFVLQKQAIWEKIIPFKSAQIDKPWFKVVIHGIPIYDFHVQNGLDLVTEEIKTFNKGFNPIGTPYWLTSTERRMTQKAGSIVVSFATEEEAKRAIKNRLYIAGISTRVEKYATTAPTTQCKKCCSYGHLDLNCKKSSSCKLYAEKHYTNQHFCTICKAKGAKCIHLEPKCVNCKQSYIADDKNCEVFIAIKGHFNKSFIYK